MHVAQQLVDVHRKAGVKNAKLVLAEVSTFPIADKLAARELLSNVGITIFFHRVNPVWRMTAGADAMTPVPLRVGGRYLGSAMAWLGHEGGLLGWGIHWQSAVALGGALAMSSTAIVVKMMADRLELETEHGRRVMGILLFQDLAVVPLLVLIPALGSPPDAMAWELAKAALENGKHVFVEKPFTSNTAQAEELIASKDKRAGLFLDMYRGDLQHAYEPLKKHLEQEAT